METNEQVVGGNAGHPDAAVPAFTLLEPEVRRCPFPRYREIREQAPVTFVADIGMFVVSSYALIQEVVRNTATFSSRGPKSASGARTKNNYSARADAIVDERGFGRPRPTLVNNDPPSHALYRGLISEAFRVSRIRKMETYIVEVVEELIASIGDAPQTDIFADFAIPLPMHVIADQIGVPREHLPQFKRWTAALLYLFREAKSEAELIEDAESVVEMHQYMSARIDERIAEPRDDILSDLARARTAEGVALTKPEIMSMLEQLLVGGSETTANAISFGLLRLAKDQSLQAALRADPSLIKRFIEELLRFESPAQGLVRTTTCPVTLGGLDIPADASVLLLYASANRDPERFEDPDTFAPDRKGLASHLAFGSGIHHCLGSELARLEMRVAFELFLKRFASFRLADPDLDLGYNPIFAVRGLKRLPLALERA